MFILIVFLKAASLSFSRAPSPSPGPGSSTTSHRFQRSVRLSRRHLHPMLRLRECGNNSSHLNLSHAERDQGAYQLAAGTGSTRARLRRIATNTTMGEDTGLHGMTSPCPAPRTRAIVCKGTHLSPSRTTFSPRYRWLEGVSKT